MAQTNGQWPCKEERVQVRHLRGYEPKTETDSGVADCDDDDIADVPPVTLAVGQDTLTCGLCAVTITDKIPPAFSRPEYAPYNAWAAYHNVKQKPAIGSKLKKKTIIARHPKGTACLGCKKTHRTLNLQTKFNCTLIQYESKYKQRGTPEADYHPTFLASRRKLEEAENAEVLSLDEPGTKKRSISRRTAVAVVQEAKDATARLLLEKSSAVKVASESYFVEQSAWNVSKHGPVPTEAPEKKDLHNDGKLYTGWYWNPNKGVHRIEMSSSSGWRQVEDADNNAGILGDERLNNT